MPPVRLRVRELRRAKAMSQADWRRELRSGLHVSEIENGETRRVDFDVLERLAMALGVDPGFLVVREPAKRAKSRV